MMSGWNSFPSTSLTLVLGISRVMASVSVGTPPSASSRRAGQVLVIDLDEPIRRQHPPPMVGQLPVAAEIRDKFGAAGWKRQARMEKGLVDRKRRVDRSASAMDDRRAR